MANIPGVPTNFVVQTANQQNLVSWNQSAGATSYIIQRSLDNVTYAPLVTITGTPLATSYLDTAVTLGTQYWYKVASINTLGSINFTGQPNNGDTASIANVTFTAVTASPGELQFQIGTSVAQTIVNFATVVNATIPGIVAATITPTQLQLSSYSTGITELASSLTNTTVIPFVSGGTSIYTQPQSVVPTPVGEMSLGEIRLQAQQRADRVNSQFVTTSEWNKYINQAMFELYDLLITVYEDLYVATPVQFTSDGSTYNYPLPNGTLSFQNGLNVNETFVAPAFYKLLGVDLAIQNVSNGYVTVNKFNFIDRNRFVYPNTASTIYGVFNLQYRVLGNNIQFIPTPTANQALRLWYIPRLTELLQDTDVTTTGISGWIEYVIVRAAKYALDKEETDTSILTQEIAFLKGRIEETAANRDAGQPDKISNTRTNSGMWGNGPNTGWNGSSGGY